MISRDHGMVDFECDICEATFASQTRDFHEALALLRAEGWAVRKHVTEWLHLCPHHTNTKLDDLRDASDNSWLDELLK